MKNSVFYAGVFLFSLSVGVNAQWQKQLLLDMQGHLFYVSSELDKPADYSVGKYSGINLFDHNPATAWVEGEQGSGVGEVIIVGAYDQVPSRVTINNGYQKSPVLFALNNRLRSADLTLMAGITLPGHETELGEDTYLLELPEHSTLMFPDTMESRTFTTTWDPVACRKALNTAMEKFKKEYNTLLSSAGAEPVARFYLKVTLRSVYRGTRWDDTCISGLVVETSGQKHGLGPGEKVTAVLETDEGRRIMVHTTLRKDLVLADAAAIEQEENIPVARRGLLVLTLMDLSPDKQWAQVNLEYGQPGGRTEEVSRLYYLPLLQQVPVFTEGKEQHPLYGFETHEGKTYLVTDDGALDLETLIKPKDPDKDEK